MKQALLMLSFLIFIPPAWSGPEPTECDRLASNPEDPDRVAPGVERADIDLPRTIAVCEAELAADPDNARTRYQLARVLFYAGQSARAVEQMKITADAGYRQAQFVYGLLISRQRDGAPTDLCITERYWLKSARNGRQAARVSYVRHYLDGRFAGCEVQPAPEEMERFLEEAAAAAGNYYEGMLIEDLAARLGAVRQGEGQSISHRE